MRRYEYKMLKGSKRQIIFLQDLKKNGQGIFECAYFILNSDGASDIAESAMLLEAERIVAEAQKLSRRCDRPVNAADDARSGTQANGRGRISKQQGAAGSNEKRQRARWRLSFALGALAGATVFMLAFSLWRAMAG